MVALEVLGLWCADGERGVFARRPRKLEGSDACERCGVVAWQHSTLRRLEVAR